MKPKYNEPGLQRILPKSTPSQIYLKVPQPIPDGIRTLDSRVGVSRAGDTKSADGRAGNYYRVDNGH